MITRDDIFKIAGELEGTCGSLDDILEKDYGVQLEDVPRELLELLDDQVLLCAQCGWWSEASEFNEDSLCAACAEDEG